MEKYQHKVIEAKWQAFWDEHKTFVTHNDASGEKFYSLCMFPYPSGAGLHVGHPLSYTATDIIAKYQRMHGKNVLYPIGWDAFGLPAENYAIKTGVHPKESTAINIANFKRQIKSLGLGYDWTREINTSSPEYYRWTQWMFKQLFEHKLAYRKEAPVNWCESCKTVLANEQVIDGQCERCNNQVIQKKLHQWFFKITNFADELIDDLEGLDWPESLKTIQRNWIGRSHGANITFEIEDESETLTVFTTRPETLFGVTYMVIAPEHPLIEKLADKIGNLKEVRDYQEQTKAKSELERMDLNKTKSGVELHGIKALNPVTKEAIPIFVSDYVLMTYGTGAIMAVPAHDQRDYDFAKKFNIKVRQVIEGGDISEAAYEDDGALMNSGFLNGMSTEEAQRSMIDHLEKGGIGYGTISYRLRDWLVSRQRYWGAPIPIVYDDQGTPYAVPDDELPVELPEDVDFLPTGESPLKYSEQFHSVEDLHRIEDKLKAAGILDEARTIVSRESDTMDTFVCSSWYFLRYTDPNNQTVFADRAQIDRWLPVDLYVGGVEHAVLHLLYARFFTKFLYRQGFIGFNEPFLRLRNQGLIMGEDGEKMSKSRGNVVNPDEVVEKYGADTFRVYEMFMGPFEDSKPWSTKGLLGAKRFLEKVWLNFEKITDGDPHPDVERLYHQTIQKVSEDVEDLRFNTAISQLMILNNAFAEHGVTRELYTGFVQLLSPFAPHIAEELWEHVGYTTSVFTSTWPIADPHKAAVTIIELPIQVNGKVRGKVMIDIDEEQESVMRKARAVPNVAAHVDNHDIKKVIYVQGKILNIIVR